jgi:hypothetical protein
MNTEFCNHKEDSIYLKISIAEPILVSCIDGASFSDIVLRLQEVVASKSILKEYLFHLVTGLFISYDGKNKIFRISNYGLELLHLIYVQIGRNIVEYADLSIKVE